MAEQVRLTRDIGSHRAGELVPKWSYAGRAERADPNVSTPARRQAKELGYPSARQMQQARAEGKARPNDPYRFDKSLGGGPAAGGVRMVGTGSMSRIIAELETAAAAGQTVAIRTTFDAGQGPRTRDIRQLPVGGPDAAGSGPGSAGVTGPLAPPHGHAGTGAPGAPVQLTFGPAGGGGMPARQLLDWIEEYDYEDDAWAWLVDLWDDAGS